MPRRVTRSSSSGGRLLLGCSDITRCPSETGKKAAASALPTIKVKPHPLGFDELYSLARQRVSQKQAQARQENVRWQQLCNELPERPKNNMAHAAPRRSKSTSCFTPQNVGSTPKSKAAQEPTDISALKATLNDALIEYGVLAQRLSTGEIPPLLNAPLLPLPPQLQTRNDNCGYKSAEHVTPAQELAQQIEPAVLSAKREAWSGSTSKDRALAVVTGKVVTEDKHVKDGDLMRLKAAFRRFQVPGSNELHVDDLPDTLGYLGHVIIDQAKLLPLQKEVTSYLYLNFDDFKRFMDKFQQLERAEFREIFDRFDVDNSGEVSVQELRGIAAALGFMPLRRMIAEALRLVDADTSGELNFDEFLTFFGVFQSCEGFAEHDVAEIKRSFEKFQFNDLKGKVALDPKDLASCLIPVFGLEVAKPARQLAEKLAGGYELKKQQSSLAEFAEEEDGTQPLTFAEVLICARKIREEQFHSLKQEWRGWGFGRDECRRVQIQTEEEFHIHDLDKSGTISEAELRGALAHRGYTALRQVMHEVCEEVLEGPWTPNRELDLNEYFDLMLVILQRDGFTRAEMMTMQTVFARFAGGGSGEISAVQLSDLFRHLGYETKLDDVRQELLSVDEDNSGELSFREFLRLMRLHREQELSTIRAVFKRCCPSYSSAMPAENVRFALAELGHKSTASEEADLQFDDFVTLADEHRVTSISEKKKKAGFSVEEMVNFARTFDTFDTNSSGCIDSIAELDALLEHFGWQVTSKSAQADIMRKLDMAREAARDAGVSNVGVDGTHQFTFWSFIQLARMEQRERDLDEEQRTRAAAEELQLSSQEVEQFRHIYRNWVQREIEQAIQAAVPGEEAELPTAEGLRYDGLKRIFRSLGASTGAQGSQRDQQLSEKFFELQHKGVLRFDSFIRVMMWSSATNFAGINDANKTARTSGEKSSRS